MPIAAEPTLVLQAGPFLTFSLRPWRCCGLTNPVCSSAVFFLCCRVLPAAFSARFS